MLLMLARTHVINQFSSGNTVLIVTQLIIICPSRYSNFYKKVTNFIYLFIYLIIHSRNLRSLQLDTRCVVLRFGLIGMLNDHTSAHQSPMSQDILITYELSNTEINLERVPTSQQAEFRVAQEFSYEITFVKKYTRLFRAFRKTYELFDIFYS